MIDDKYIVVHFFFLFYLLRLSQILFSRMVMFYNCLVDMISIGSP